MESPDLMEIQIPAVPSQAEPSQADQRIWKGPITKYNYVDSNCFGLHLPDQFSFDSQLYSMV